MAKAKKKPSEHKQQAPDGGDAAESKSAADSGAAGDDTPEPEKRLGITDYLLLNVAFVAFCLVQFGLVALFLRETRGLWYFFGLMVLGFAVVSVFDYVYERWSNQPAEAS